jgi:hypothetical protein
MKPPVCCLLLLGKSRLWVEKLAAVKPEQVAGPVAHIADSVRSRDKYPDVE